MDYAQTASIPDPIREEAARFIPEKHMRKGRRLFTEARASISFQKHVPEAYDIVSGIVRDNRPHEVKFSYKKRLEDSPEGPFSSGCDCDVWSPTEHCSHVAALFLTFHTRLAYQDESKRSDRPPMPSFGGPGVSVEQYGTIVNGPQKLIGAPPSSVYSSLQYLLADNRVVNFSLPEKFEGKLVLDLIPSDKSQEATPDIVPGRKWRFRYLNEEEAVVDEVSLFENLYLFNWRTGKSYHLPSGLKEFVKKLQLASARLSQEELIALAIRPELESVLDLHLGGKPFSEFEKEEVLLRVEIVPSKRKGHANVELIFHDRQEHRISPPGPLKTFAFTGGELGGFPRKKDAYEFIEALGEYLEDGKTNWSQKLLGVQNRGRWIALVDLLERDLYGWNEESNTVVHYDSVFIKKLIAHLVKDFGPQFFRWSNFLSDEKVMEYMIPLAPLFTGLTAFREALAPYGTTIYYDQREVSHWNGRVSFERRQRSMGWFDLELKIPLEDLEVIKKGDLDSGLALTSAGLVLLSEEQKDLLRFMKKYVEHEKSEESVEEGKKRFLLPFRKARIFELFELKRLGVEGALTKEEEELCERLLTFEEMPSYPVPDDLKGELRSYQLQGYQWLRFLYENRLGACLADDMGLGKTFQTISFISSIYDNLERVLVVCPVSILLNWQKEFEKFSDIPTHIFHGGDRSLPKDAKIILTSYGVMKKEAAGLLKDLHFDVLILDEVQHLKNVRSLGAYAARELNADFRICLTGTPVENDLAEFYNVMDLAVPGIWGDLQFIKTTSTRRTRLIARRMAKPFVLRRTKAQVLTDLPPKQEDNVSLALSHDERVRYERTLVRVRSRIQDAPSRKKYGEILKGLLELRQSCLWQRRDQGAATVSYKNVDSTKVDFLIENLEQILEEGHQAIIFSQFTTYLDIIQHYIQEKHWKYSRIDGSMPIKRRQKQVDEFQSGQNPLFLISLKAGGTGLNLTAASYVFIMDPWWNPAVEAQAIDRAHRIGQQNTLTVYRPIIKDSVEEKVLKLQEAKRELFRDLLPESDDQMFTGKLSMQDFEKLFS